MFDELWEDTSSRIRGVGVNELSVSINYIIVLLLKLTYFIIFLLVK
jgi:hypothetical protein